MRDLRHRPPDPQRPAGPSGRPRRRHGSRVHRPGGARRARAPAALAVGQRVSSIPIRSAASAAPCRAGRPASCENIRALGIFRHGALAPLVKAPADAVFPLSDDPSAADRRAHRAAGLRRERRQQGEPAARRVGDHLRRRGHRLPVPRDVQGGRRGPGHRRGAAGRAGGRGHGAVGADVVVAPGRAGCAHGGTSCPFGADVIVDAVGTPVRDGHRARRARRPDRAVRQNQTARPPIHQYTITERSLTVLGLVHHGVHVPDRDPAGRGRRRSPLEPIVTHVLPLDRAERRPRAAALGRGDEGRHHPGRRPGCVSPRPGARASIPTRCPTMTFEEALDVAAEIGATGDRDRDRRPVIGAASADRRAARRRGRRGRVPATRSPAAACASRRSTARPGRSTRSSVTSTSRSSARRSGWPPSSASASSSRCPAARATDPGHRPSTSPGTRGRRTSVALLERQWDDGDRPVAGPRRRKPGRGHRAHRLRAAPAPSRLQRARPYERMRDAVGPIIGVNLDPSHLFWQGWTRWRSSAPSGPAVHHVHLKDTEIVRRPGGDRGRPRPAPVRRSGPTGPGSSGRPGRIHGPAWWVGVRGRAAGGRLRRRARRSRTRTPGCRRRPRSSRPPRFMQPIIRG